MRKPQAIKQSGVILLEALIGILVFSLGALALVAMYANAFTVATDAQYRMEANNYANKLLNTMWISANRTTLGTIGPSIAPFAHNADVGGSCEAGFSGEGGNAAIDAWIAEVTAEGTGLPGATGASVQVLFNAAAGNEVTITVCWQAPSDSAPRRHVLVGNVN